ncbi:hypothetical protein BY996DRAFT_6480870 [Phakopsora pachyrhizi]|nr:hypothetical protein BY996DRAFT_6480870 [Phakopsora pachyrhizi]
MSNSNFPPRNTRNSQKTKNGSTFITRDRSRARTDSRGKDIIYEQPGAPTSSGQRHGHPDGDDNTTSAIATTCPIPGTFTTSRGSNSRAGSCTDNSSYVGKQTTRDQSYLGQHLRVCCQILTDKGKLDDKSSNEDRTVIELRMTNKQTGRLMVGPEMLTQLQIPINPRVVLKEKLEENRKGKQKEQSAPPAQSSSKEKNQKHMSKNQIRKQKTHHQRKNMNKQNLSEFLQVTKEIMKQRD